jgi:hypothetical protein
VDNLGESVVAVGTTLFPGASSPDACVPVKSQLSPEAGQAFFVPGSALDAAASSASTSSLDTCMASCAAATCCLSQFDASNPSSFTCKTITLTPGASSSGSSSQLVYKLPPATLTSASSVKCPRDKPNCKAAGSVKANMMSSGYYAHCDIAAGSTTAWQGLGTPLGADARTFAAAPVWDAAGIPSSASDAAAVAAAKLACKRKCDNGNVCLGFVWSPTQGCLYRGGVDALKSRAFFVLPSSSTLDVAALNW